MQFSSAQRRMCLTAVAATGVELKQHGRNSPAQGDGQVSIGGRIPFELLRHLADPNSFRQRLPDGVLELLHAITRIGLALLIGERSSYDPLSTSSERRVKRQSSPHGRTS
jgi:hypothetical protein